jgi:hypothetical protein
MTQAEIVNTTCVTDGDYKVDIARGERNGRVSSEWFSRTDDERFLSPFKLTAAVRGRTERNQPRSVDSATIRVEVDRDDAERLALILPGSDAPIAPTHSSFGQLADLVGAPSAYPRQLPAELAGINLQYGLVTHRAAQIKTLEIDNGRAVPAPITAASTTMTWSPIACDSTGDTR